MNILVTGGAGFIGSNFIYYELEKHPEDSIVCLDALTYAGSLKTLSSAMECRNFRFVRGRIEDRQCVNELFEEERFDAVVNFAAESHVDRSLLNPEEFLVTNVLGTQVLLDACRRYGTGRFHQVSTDEVYGDLPIDGTAQYFTEATPLRPSSPYSASKASADLLVLAYHRTYGISVSISRCGNNYGPYQFPEKLVPLMIIRAIENLPLPIYGKGENIRDWLYVLDHCAAIDAILRRGRDGEMYNVGGHNERSNIDVVRSILAILDKPESLISFVADRPGHDKRYGINPEKISTELHWSPCMEFDEGLFRTVKWYVDNRDWWAQAKGTENLIGGHSCE